MALTKIGIDAISGAIGTTQLEDGSVTSAKIANSTIAAADIASGVITPTAVADQANSSTGYFGMPVGTTAQRPESPTVGMIRYNTTIASLEQYTASGWGSIAPPPTVTDVSPSTYNGESGTTFTITGTQFLSDAAVTFIDNAGNEYNSTVVSYINSTTLTATTPQDFTIAQEPLDVKVTQGSGFASLLECIDCGGVPSWTTSSGSLTTVDEGSAVSTTIAATDPDSSATITYSIASGSLPSGVSLNASSGAITGTAPSVAGDTTYSFTAAATDNAGNSSSRSFSIGVTDVKISTVDFFGDGSGKALWQMENNYNDVSGNYSGTSYTTGSASYSSSNKRFGSYSFNSNGPNIFAFPGPVSSYPLTVSAWISTADWGGTASQNREIMNGDIGGQRLTLTYADFNNNGTYDFMIMFGGVGHWDYRAATSPPALTNGLNNFVHICYCISGSENAVVYLNGVALTPYNNGGGHGGSAGWRMGGNTAGDEYWRGNMDQVRVFNKALSSGEVATLYAHELAR